VAGTIQQGLCCRTGRGSGKAAANTRTRSGTARAIRSTGRHRTPRPDLDAAFVTHGTKRWYRLFVQTTITSNAVLDGGNGLPETQLVFTARGRHAAVPCKGQYDMVPAPKDETVGTGYDAWSEWHEWKRTAAVSCDGEAGVITTRARDVHGMEGDDFSDGFHLTTKLAEGAGESVFCTAISTHPLGGNGDEERAWVRFAAVSR